MDHVIGEHHRDAEPGIFHGISLQRGEVIGGSLKELVDAGVTNIPVLDIAAQIGVLWCRQHFKCGQALLKCGVAGSGAGISPPYLANCPSYRIETSHIRRLGDR